ncbi:pleiotropic drug resistance protein 3-like [Gossypium australe]|uniref:Pleiotropic drug resistance protein 3-like n=1 Tax=Gossypium australe TaxID=47621 RepID=A0A5B6VIQ4_9ROSI|nr:pleiotropic drug resistance protein 3-like [Gossypium australe]
MDMSRFLLFKKKLPNKLWAEFGFKPLVSHLKIFGCLCYALIPATKRNKVKRRVQLDIFVGYNSCKKVYRTFDPFTSKVFESRYVKFSKEALWNWEATEAEMVGQCHIELNV